MSRIRVSFRLGSFLSERLPLRSWLRWIRTSVFWQSVAAGLLTFWFLAWHHAHRIPQWQPGTVATQTVRSPFDLVVVDERETQLRREQARRQVPPVYIWDNRVVRVLHARIHTIFEAGRAWDGRSPMPAALEGIPPTARAWLQKRKFSEELEDQIHAWINEIYRHYVVTLPSLLETNSDGFITVRNAVTGREMLMQRQDLPLWSMEDVRRFWRERLGHSRRGSPDLAVWLADQCSANLWPQTEETLRRQREAMTAVPPVKYEIHRGQTIIRAGQRVTPQVAMMLAQIASYQTRGRIVWWMVGIGIFTIIAVTLLYLGMARLPVSNILLRDKPLFTVGVVIWFVTVLLLVVENRYFLAGMTAIGLSETWERAFVYSLPFALGTCIWLVFNDRARAAWFGLWSAPLLGLALNMNFWQFMFVLGAVSLPILALRTYGRRMDILIGGLRLGVLLALWQGLLVWMQFQTDAWPQVTQSVAMAFVSGLWTSVLTFLLLPVLESVFDIVTDMKLLEISSLHHPLLQRLAIQAPGTYFHSIAVGQLAEAAAKAIGVNGLLLRVAALYHDIGKMAHPQYFVENQRRENPHDRIHPNVSRLIIFSHVREGMEIARKYRLPRIVVDLIPQHHGTKLLTYFYRKACAIEPDGKAPDETLYRYAGPKPQSKEAAILMLADSIEAAARSLKEPTPKKLENVVDNIIDYCMKDGQLDETDLTLGELHKIRDAMWQALVTMYHQRVQYPDFDFGEGSVSFEAPVISSTEEPNRPIPTPPSTS